MNVIPFRQRPDHIPTPTRERVNALLTAARMRILTAPEKAELARLLSLRPKVPA